ncbi:hypothetical protein HUJ04_001417 [Dendroctonus ponderosae]|nr:hypothetical protein HUJ04_001417 [Dendroctonus ponderosae]
MPYAVKAELHKKPSHFERSIGLYIIIDFKYGGIFNTKSVRKEYRLRVRWIAHSTLNHPANQQVWINQGDIFLLGLRDYQDAKADVILKYTPEKARNLKLYGEFPESFKISDDVTFVENDLDELNWEKM